mgnify:CR=1 FL=1
MAKKELTTFKVNLEIDDKGAVKKVNGMKTNLEGMGNQGGKSLGGLSKGFMKMAGGVAVATTAIVTLKKAMEFATRVGGDFQQAMANVKAISGATGKSFQDLEQDAMRLGASTMFTASQVAELQLEYSKLGFTSDEIVNATESTLALASATGESLASSAMVAGNTLRGFGLEATEMGRVTDVMAKSFSSSALDLESFRESMKLLAPVAKGVGFSLEETTALMGELANVGLRGSLSGTALKNIFIKMGDESGKLTKKFGKPIKTFEDLQEVLFALKEENVDFQEALGLTDKRAVTAFLALADGAKRVTDLKEKLDDAGGSAQEMAEIQMATLQGSMKELTSATEGLGIAMFEHFGGALETVVDGMTNLVTAMKDIIEVPLSDKMEEDRKTMNSLFEIAKDANKPIDDRKWAINRLNKEYDTYLPNLLDEKTSVEEIAKAQRTANESYMQTIVLRAKEEKILETIKKHDKAIENRRALELKLNNSRQERLDMMKELGMTEAEIEEASDKALDKTSRNDRITVRNKKDMQAFQLQQYEELMLRIEDEQNALMETNDTYSLLDKELQVVKDRYDDLADSMGKLKFDEKAQGSVVPPVKDKDKDKETEGEVDDTILSEEQKQAIREEYLKRRQNSETLYYNQKFDLLDEEYERVKKVEEDKAGVEKFYADQKRQLLEAEIMWQVDNLAKTTDMMARSGMISAKWAKRVAIFQTTLSTYQNVVGGWKAGLQLPPPANVVMPPVLAGLALAQGLAQVRMIQKQKFAKGGLVTSPTLALIGEKGQDEFVAPKQDFKEWANTQMGEMTFNANNSQTLGKLDDIHNAITSQDFPSSTGIADAIMRGSRGRLS